MGNVTSKSIGTVYIPPYINYLILKKTIIYYNLHPKQEIDIPKCKINYVNINLKDKDIDFFLCIDKLN